MQMGYGKSSMNSQHLSHFRAIEYPGPSASSTGSAAIFEEIDQYVIAQCFWGCEEGSTMIDLRHLLDEVA
jgi:hypothetical protein